MRHTLDARDLDRLAHPVDPPAELTPEAQLAYRRFLQGHAHERNAAATLAAWLPAEVPTHG